MRHHAKLIGVEIPILISELSRVCGARKKQTANDFAVCKGRLVLKTNPRAFFPCLLAIIQ
jgi:hypothetical protein